MDASHILFVTVIKDIIVPAGQVVPSPRFAGLMVAKPDELIMKVPLLPGVVSQVKIPLGGPIILIVLAEPAANVAGEVRVAVG
jgi:hypothetical protein